MCVQTRVSGGGQQYQSTEVYQATTTAVTTKAHVYGCYLIDASGSMYGEPIRTAMKYVHELSTELLSKNDNVSVYTFNNTLQEHKEWHNVPVSCKQSKVSALDVFLHACK
jgi:uncharacterized protein with von Willebrand factor type A (vWA) domain